MSEEMTADSVRSYMEGAMEACVPGRRATMTLFVVHQEIQEIKTWQEFHPKIINTGTRVTIEMLLTPETEENG